MNVNSTEDEFHRFAQWTRHVFTDYFCLDLSFFSRVSEAQNHDWNDIQELAWGASMHIAYPFVSRSQFFLQCSELGMFPTSVNAESAFGTTIGQDFYFLGCTEVFYDEYEFEVLDGAINNLQQVFGGKLPEVSNVVFTNGQLDPYYSFGITEDDPSRNLTVINIPCEYEFVAILVQENIVIVLGFRLWKVS